MNPKVESGTPQENKEPTYRYQLDDLVREHANKYVTDPEKSPDEYNSWVTARTQDFTETYQRYLSEASAKDTESEQARDNLGREFFEEQGIDIDRIPPFHMGGVLLQTFDALSQKYRAAPGGALGYFSDLFLYGRDNQKVNGVIKMLLNEDRQRLFLDMAAEADKSHWGQQALLYTTWQDTLIPRSYINEEMGKSATNHVTRLSQFQLRLRERV